MRSAWDFRVGSLYVSRVRVELVAKIEFVGTGQVPITLEWKKTSGMITCKRLIIAGWVSVRVDGWPAALGL